MKAGFDFQLDEFEPDAVLEAHERAKKFVPIVSDDEVRYLPTGERVSWEPLPGGQTLFLFCPFFECLLEGNRGGGKTEVLIADFCSHVGVASPARPLAGYGRYWRGILFRRTYPELVDVIEKTMRIVPLFSPAAKYNNQAHMWTFPDGEVLRFAYADSEMDYWAYHGHEYPWVAWEELTTWKDDKLFLKMMSICRASLPHMPRKYRGSTNPFGVGHHWVKARYKLPMKRNGIIENEKDDRGNVLHTRCSVNVKLEDNFRLLKADPDYLQKLRALADDPATAAAWIDGNWDVTSGGMFDDLWNQKVHVVPDFIPPQTWYIDRAYDDGSSAPFAVGWFAESDGTDLLLPGGTIMPTVKGDIFLFREWYGFNGREGKNEGLKLDVSQISEGIVSRELDWNVYGRVWDGPADSAIFAKNHGVSIADDFAQPITYKGKRYRGLFWQSADKSPGTRVPGWKQIRSRLRAAYPDDKGRRHRPGLFICESCHQWRRTVPTMPRDPKKPDDVEVPEDHMGDMTRYRLHNPPRRIVQRPTVGGF